jgi:hypothetical protein
MAISRNDWLGAEWLVSLNRFVTALVEDGSTSGGKNHLRLTLRTLTLDLDETIYQRVFPNGMPRARSLPCLHGLGVGSTTTCYPSEKL